MPEQKITDIQLNRVTNNSVSQEEVVSNRRVGESVGGPELGMVSGMSGYAELFESAEAGNISCGYFVTLEGRKIRRATSKDKYILGVTTVTPAILGIGTDSRWKNKYITDEWGQIQYQEVILPALLDEEGNILMSEHKEKQPRINPKWDRNRPYIPRILRAEWVAVGLIGQILVRDNGSCKINGYCVPNDDGIAESSNRGYRVLERRTENQILILLRTNTITSNPISVK